MPNLSAILVELRRERNRLDRAIVALEGVTSNGRRPSKHRISTAGRRRIAAAQRARWAKLKGEKVVSFTVRKRTMSPSARKKIAAAQRARWARFRRQQKTAA